MNMNFTRPLQALQEEDKINKNSQWKTMVSTILFSHKYRRISPVQITIFLDNFKTAENFLNIFISIKFTLFQIR